MSHQTLLPFTVPRRAFDKTLASAFEKRVDLRNIISLALRRLCVQTSLAMNAHGHQVGEESRRSGTASLGGFPGRPHLMTIELVTQCPLAIAGGIP